MNQNRQHKHRYTAELTFGALALALSILFLGLSYILPLSFLVLIIFIPFLSALLAFNSSFRSQAVFFASIIIVSFIDIQDGLFYLIPNTLIGLCYGNLVKARVDRVLMFIVTSALSFILSYFSIYPIRLLFKVDLIEVFAAFFGLGPERFEIVVPSFFLMLALIQTFIMFATVEGEMRKFKIKAVDSPHRFLLIIVLLTIVSVLAVPASLISESIGYLGCSYAILLAVLLTAELFALPHKAWRRLLGFVVALALSGVFITSTFVSRDMMPYATLLYGLVIDVTGIALSIYSYIFRDCPVGPDTFHTNDISEDEKDLLDGK